MAAIPRKEPAIPVQDLSKLRTEVARAGARWKVRKVSDDEVRGLGWERSAPHEVAIAKRLGTTYLQELRRGPALLTLAQSPAIKGILKRIKFPPASFDWRTYGVVGPVQDQRRCGSCVSFATTGLVGAQAAIERGITNLHLSEADQHFCSSHGPSCAGWNNHTALDQIRSRGVVTNGAFPYMSAFDNPPVADPGNPNVWAAHCRGVILRPYRAYSITNFTAHSGSSRKSYLSTVGPMVCGFTVYQDFDNYGGGVYHHVTGTARGGHAVLVVGYSDLDGAWICRNSWGAAWGGPARSDGTGAGYFKLAYGDSNIDSQPFYGCTGVIPPRVLDFRLLAEMRRAIKLPNLDG